MNQPFPPPKMQTRRLGWKQWLGRFLAGLIFGWVWNSFVQLDWVGLATAIYGSLERALNQMQPGFWMGMAFAGYFASAPASFFGGLVGPLALDCVPRIRRPMVCSSASGAALAAATGTVLGLFAGCVIWHMAGRSMLIVWVPLGLSVPVGVGSGVLGGMIVSRLGR
jgi:hypothetical protein